MNKYFTIFFIILLSFLFYPVQEIFSQISFSAKTDFTTANSPAAIVTTDFNGDGKIDVASANQLSNSFSVFMNTTATNASTPTFSAKTDFTAGTQPLGITTADFNGDGKIDIAVSNNNGNNVSVCFNTTTPGSATPTFSAKTDFSVGTDASQIVTGDFNGDGKIDIAVANRLSNSFSVLLNTITIGSSTPSFAAATNFTTGTQPETIALGDINGDGKPDIITGNTNANTVSVFINTTTTNAATPTFTAKTDFAPGSTVQGVNLGDLNGDGKPDMVAVNYFSNTISVFLNTTTPGSTTPTFGAKTDFAVNGGAFVLIRDVNQDGKKDLVVTGVGVTVFLNTTTPGSSTPTFASSVNFATGNTPLELAVADFNGDGKPDVTTANYTSNSVSVLLNTTTFGGSSATFSAKTDFTAGTTPYTVTIGDLNGDGKPDFATANSTTNNASVFFNTTAPGAGTPSFSAKTDFTTATDPEYLAMADFNGDGKLDLVTANYGAGNISVLMNITTTGSATPSFSAKTDFATGSGAIWVSTGDMNGDGRPDVATANSTANTVSVFFNTTTPGASTPSFTAKTDFTTGTAPYSVQIRDINGDGKPELIAGNGSSNTISVLINNTTPGSSTPSFGAKTDFATGTAPACVILGDINGDGKPDMVTGNNTANTQSILLNTTTPGSSTPTFTAKTDIPGGGSSFSVELGDINCDGKLDMAVTNNGTTTVSVYFNTTTPGSSTPTFGTRTDFTVGSFPSLVAIWDLNGDGKRDLAVANATSNNISVLLSTQVLPVELASFTSSVNGNNVTLNWNTASEENNSGFDIERNSFGTGWQKVGFVNGSGTTNQPNNYSYSDINLASGNYSYRLKQIDYNGNFKYYELQNEVVIGVPNKFVLDQNYPNPFNPVTRINYELPITNYVSLKIFDIAGKEVAQLMNGVQQAGYYSIDFNAALLSNGTYFYKLTSDNFSDVKKMVVVK